MRNRRWRITALALGLFVGISLIGGAAASLNLASQAFTPYRTCTVTATPATTTAVIDATVRQGSAATNFGWMIRDDAEGSATTRTVTFSSKEQAIVAQAPQLVITYVTVS